jgi:hypothetical protein
MKKVGRPKKVKKKKKFKDEFLKPFIFKAIQTLNTFCITSKIGDQVVYYEGNFSEDVLNNFSDSQSKQIFDDMKRIHNDKNLSFTQKKIKDFANHMDLEEDKEPKFFYEYKVVRVA